MSWSHEPRVRVLWVGFVALSACGSSGDPAAPLAEPPAATSAAGPTWYRDIEPIVQVSCAGCHTENGTGGFVLTSATSVSLADFVAGKLTSRYMPPWQPSTNGVPLSDPRALSDAEIAAWQAWADAGAPLGDAADHVERAPRAATLPARPFDLELTMPTAYEPPVSKLITDEIRCFVLDVPRGGSVVASQWHAGQPVGVHSLSAVPLDSAATATAHALENADGRPGFACGGGYGALPHGPPIGTAGAAFDLDGSTLPSGTAAVIPPLGALLMRVHYAVAHLGGAADISKVRLWFALSAMAPLELVTITAPVEVPCPSGRCSRDDTFARLANADAKAAADALLTTCGKQDVSFTDANPDHFYVPTSCTSTLDHDVTIQIVHPRMHTYGASMKVEAEASDGAFHTILEIPTWRWAWDSPYVLAEGVPVAAGRRVRVSCIFDNGTIPQWSALTGQPGHDAYARPPLLPAQYLIYADSDAGEECVAYLAVTQASPSTGMTLSAPLVRAAR